MFFDIKITCINRTVGFKAKSNNNYNSKTLKNLVIDAILNENNAEINRNFEIGDCKFKVTKNRKKDIFYYRTIFKLS
jgi:hypothetical protein